MAQTKKQPMIAASEVAEFVFCAKAWQLKRLGETAESAHLDPGKEFHESHSARAWFAYRLRRAAIVCGLLAFLLFIAAMLLRGSSAQ